MTSKLGRKRPSQEPISPTSKLPEAKRLCEPRVDIQSLPVVPLFGRLGRVLWTAGGSVAHAAGALGSLATFRSRRGASETDATPDESQNPATDEVSDAVVLDVNVMLGQKEADACRFDQEMKTELKESDCAHGDPSFEKQTVSTFPGAQELPQFREAKMDAAAEPVVVTPQAGQIGALPEAACDADIEIEYQRLLKETATLGQEIDLWETDALGQDPVTISPTVSNWGAPAATSMACEAHVQAMSQVAGEFDQSQLEEDRISKTQEGEFSQVQFEEDMTQEAQDYEAAPQLENDHACVVSFAPTRGHPHCESGPYCRGTAQDDLFEDGGDVGHYYCGPCFDAAGVV